MVASSSRRRLARDYGLDGRELDDSFVTRIAGDHGFEAAVVRASWRKLCRLGEALPVLARLKNGHTVALLAIVREAGVAKAVVHDPLAEGSSQLRVPRRAFIRAYSGKVTLLRPMRDVPTAEKTFGIGWFIPEILKQSSIMRDVAIAAIVLQFLSLASPIFFQLVVDKVLVHESPTTLTVLLIGVGLALVLDGLFRYLRQYLLLFATNRIDIRLARKTFEKLMSLGLTFFEKNTAGVLTQHMQQTERIRQFLTGRLFGTVLDGFGLFDLPAADVVLQPQADAGDAGLRRPDRPGHPGPDRALPPAAGSPLHGRWRAPVPARGDRSTASRP